MATIKSGSRTRSIGAVARGGMDEFATDQGNVARCELDSHADTCVAGPDFLIFDYTGQQCDVTPYTNDYQPIISVSVVNAATACTDESTGETIILLHNQVLWYGKRMKMSLINPKQMRHYGVTVSDDPTDSTRVFGATLDDTVIPFKMDGTVVYFKSRMPSRYELDNCKTVIMTDGNVWDPTNVRSASVSVMSGVTNLPIVETSERLRISCMGVKTAKTANSEDQDCNNEMIPFDHALFLNRMIGKVHVAIAYRDAKVAFVEARNDIRVYMQKLLRGNFVVVLRQHRKPIKQLHNVESALQFIPYPADIALIILTCIDGGSQIPFIWTLYSRKSDR